MTLDLAKLKALHAAATQGDYEYAGYFPDDEWELSPIISKVQGEQTEFHGTEQDLRLIEALHNSAPELIARAELLEEAVPTVESLFALAVAWSGVYGGEHVGPMQIHPEHEKIISASKELMQRYRALEAENGKY